MICGYCGIVDTTLGWFHWGRAVSTLRRLRTLSLADARPPPEHPR
ncbi:hypothetical protein BZL30_5931 [Mycobacterium kansasii]|uniref:Uncharacterized protein n=1 Tax=Mycobacterium kansasii TaxID=1768 RepID=A0A1V3WZG6_MYCKA|nr:hypothetical protein BZL30_5931 [Mycobacterium kansasii]